MISFLQLVEKPKGPINNPLGSDARLQDAFEHPELYNWDSLPTVPEKAVMDALDGEVVYTSCSQKDLLDAALSQPELVMIVGNVVRRFVNTPARKPEQVTDQFEERYGEKNW